MNIVFPSIILDFKSALTKEIGLAFRPMQLIQINIIGLQASQTFVYGQGNTGRRKIHIFSDIGQSRIRAGNF